jgi:hypothetical protein
MYIQLRIRYFNGNTEKCTLQSPGIMRRIVRIPEDGNILNYLHVSEDAIVI